MRAACIAGSLNEVERAHVQRLASPREDDPLEAFPATWVGECGDRSLDLVDQLVVAVVFHMATVPVPTAGAALVRLALLWRAPRRGTKAGSIVPGERLEALSPRAGADLCDLTT